MAQPAVPLSLVISICHDDTYRCQLPLLTVYKVYNIAATACTCEQVNEAAEIIYDLVDQNANLIFGAVVDPKLGQEVSSYLCYFVWPVLG